MTEQRKTVVAAIIENRTATEDYNGPLSHLGEMHAVELGFKYGLISGLMKEAPDVATGAAMLSGVSTVRKLADTGIPKYARRNTLYVVVSFMVGLVIGATLGPVMPSMA